jgi:hypothetical protein
LFLPLNESPDSGNSNAAMYGQICNELHVQELPMYLGADMSFPLLESMLIWACVGVTEQCLSWLSNAGTSRTIRSELKAHEGFKCWDFQASICLVLLSFYYGSLILWRATGLDRSLLFTYFHQDYFQGDWIV